MNLSFAVVSGPQGVPGPPGPGSSVALSGYITTGQADLRYYPLESNPSGYLTNGSITISGYSTGLSSSATGPNVSLRIRDTEIVEVLGNGVSGSFPPSQSLLTLVNQPIRGATGFMLGEPDGWWSILVSGRSARVPYYYA